MASVPTPTSSFDVLTGPVHDHLLAAAATATTRAVTDPSQGVLVVVVRPTSDDHQVIAGGGTGILRAAVSVAVGAGNDRAWRDAPALDTEERAVRSLPEVITAAADGIRAVHVGCVRVGDVVESVALWFETHDGVAPADVRRETLALLADAGERERQRRAELDAAAASEPSGATVAARREFDADDPSLDPVTGVLGADRFDDLIADYERDEAMLVLIDLDGFSTVGEQYGRDTADAILREIADRLVANCRRDDAIARTGHDRFAVLFGQIDRSEVVQVAKRLLAVVAEPLPPELGPEQVTGTVALAHQVGLVDLEEMIDAATNALASGKRSGAGRLVLAA